MAQISSRAALSLRAISYRISSTPTEQLPHMVRQIAGCLWNCKDILSAPQESTKSNGEIATIVHRFKTQVSSLLQDRTIEGRWAAVVLAKAVIEAGGPEVLNKSNGWVRSLLAILKKSDPPTTRNLAVITLTRIFMLTWDYSNLVREITTPALPAFIASCLNNIEAKRCSANELQTVLEAFATLIPRHHTIFRTHEPQIRSLLLTTLSLTSSDAGSSLHYTQSHTYAARRLLVLLHYCAPKQGAGEKWDESLRATVSAAHATCDRVFRSAIEIWTNTAGVETTAPVSTLAAGQAEFEGEDVVGLRSWKGIFSGCERTITLLRLLQSHLEMATSGTVVVRVGLITDLLTRIFSLIVSSDGKAGTLKINNEISKDEREAMLSVLPIIHVAALELLDAIIDRFGPSIMSITQGLLDSVVGLFDAEHDNVDIRIVTYRTLRAVLQLTGPSMMKEDIADLSLIVKACCEDLLPTEDKARSKLTAKTNGVSQKQPLSNGDLALQTSRTQPSHPTALIDLHSSAHSLLPVLLTKIRSTFMPKKARVQIERTAILTRNKEALVACVLNPAAKGKGDEYNNSLLPLLAQEYPDSAVVEALLRPRMPLITTKSSLVDANEAEEFSEIQSDARAVSPDEQVLNGEEPTDDENEPTAGLLSALGQNEGDALTRDESEDLYSATPPPRAGAHSTRAESGIPMSEVTTAKRAADESIDAEISAKRLRSSPMTQPLAEGHTAATSIPDVASAQPSLLVAGTADDSTTRSQAIAPGQMATLPAQPELSVAAQSVGALAGIDSDDSDFEIPPLTMELDTEPEDEDEEEDGEEE